MSLSAHPKAYGTAAVALAFLGGIALALGFKDFYPDLEHRFQQSRLQRRRRASRSRGLPDLRQSSMFAAPVELEDREHGDLGSSNAKLPILSQQPPPSTHGLDGTIGRTPLIELKSLSKATGRIIYAKAEYLNGAGGSPKDRVALSILRAAEEAGNLVPGRGDWVYEGTAGSTGISLTTLATALGYHAHLIMPDDMAIEKSDLLKALGATVERVPVAPITDPNHFVNQARSKAKSHATRKADGSRGFFADQFENPANWRAHFETTGPEIHWQTNGKIDMFVCGAGTGGTISGIAKYLKDTPVSSPNSAVKTPSRKGENGSSLGNDSVETSSPEKQEEPKVKVVLADPQGSGLYNKIKNGVMFAPTEKEGTRRRQQVDTIVEGIGITRITGNFEAGMDLIDDAVKVTDDQAMRMASWLVEHEGLFCGSSTAVNCVAAVVAAMSVPKGSTVVTLLCDSGNRHLSKFWRLIQESRIESPVHDKKNQDLWQTIGVEKPVIATA